MDLCQLKNSELEPQLQKYKDRVVLRGDIVKDDSGSYTVFTEQGSSASQMTAAKVLDITSRLPGCAGQAVDAVSAYTQVKMEDAPTLLIIPKSECPDIWIRLPKHKWPKSWSSMEDPVVLLERNLYGHPLAGLFVGTAIRESSYEIRLGKSSELGMSFRTPSKNRSMETLDGRRGSAKGRRRDLARSCLGSSGFSLCTYCSFQDMIWNSSELWVETRGMRSSSFLPCTEPR